MVGMEGCWMSRRLVGQSLAGGIAGVLRHRHHRRAIVVIEAQAVEKRHYERNRDQRGEQPSPAARRRLTLNGTHCGESDFHAALVSARGLQVQGVAFDMRRML